MDPSKPVKESIRASVAQGVADAMAGRFGPPIDFSAPEYQDDDDEPLAQETIDRLDRERAEVAQNLSDLEHTELPTWVKGQHAP